MNVHAEISIVPIAGGHDTSMSKEVAAAFDAIRKIKGLKAYFDRAYCSSLPS